MSSHTVVAWGIQKYVEKRERKYFFAPFHVIDVNAISRKINSFRNMSTTDVVFPESVRSSGPKKCVIVQDGIIVTSSSAGKWDTAWRDIAPTNRGG